MRILPIILTIFFGIFATAVMSYISMATPIGPWIAPTIVLCVLLLMKIIHYDNQSETIALVVAGSSVGGIIATACGFSYPAFYFLNPALFNEWLNAPLYFIAVLAGLSITAGAFGMVGANLFENSLVIEQNLSFPIGQLIYKMIVAGNQIKKAIELFIGFCLTFIFCIIQDGIAFFSGIIPKAVTLIGATRIGVFAIPAVHFDIWPMLWAIGFVTGHVIAIPLAVGAFLKIGVVDPIHTSYFSQLSSVEFVLAFCSGMVLYGSVTSFIKLPAMLLGGIRWIQANGNTLLMRRSQEENRFIHIFSWLFVLASGTFFLMLLDFSLLTIFFLFITSFACMYQVAFIAGKIGLAPLGRFATFVMVPAMLLFPLTIPQIVIVATFVEIACGVVADILFSRKMAFLMHLDRRWVTLYQLLGLVVGASTVGVVFWFLISHFQLGSPELLAYKAQGRQLLIHARHFDWYVLFLGGICTFFLQFIKVNPMLVLGGLLMPLNISIGLVFGGLLTLLIADRERWEPFWSGVFAANSIWMLIKAIF